MSSIPGTKVTGTLVPTDSADNYAVTDSIYGIDGLRNVADHDARNMIPLLRRRQGMVVGTQDDGLYWKLKEDTILEPWTVSDASDPAANANWEEFASAINNGIKNVIEVTDDITIPVNYQYLVYGDLTINGSLTNNGELVIINGDLIIGPSGTFNNPGELIFEPLETQNIIPITYSNLVTLYNAGSMETGFYKITDGADAGIIIQAVSNTTLSSNAVGIFLDPDFQGIGTYTTGLHTQLGIWHAGLTPSSLMDVCIWNGVHWVYAGGGNTEPGTDVNWTEYTKASQIAGLQLGYIEIGDYIEFDFISNIITRRVDKRGNDVKGGYNYQTFQWGNDVVLNNTFTGTVNCLNSVCASIKGNIIENGITLNFSILPVGATFDNNYICNAEVLGSGNLTVTLSSLFTLFTGNRLHCVTNTDFTSSAQSGMIGKSLVGNISTFEEQFDLNGTTQIDISGCMSYIGVIQVQDNSITYPTVADLITIIGLNPNIDRVIKIIPDVCVFGALILRINNGIGTFNLYCNQSSDKLLKGENGDWIEFTYQTRNNGSRRLYQSAEGIYGPATGITDITYSDLYTLYSTGAMVPGLYRITDRADAGITIRAISSTALSLNATAVFINPDYQNAGEYGDIATYTGMTYTSTYGVWSAANEASRVNGDVVIYDGKHYQVVDDSLFDGTYPQAGVNGYFEFDKVSYANTNVGFITEVDYIEYDLFADIITIRKDKRNNVVANAGLDLFQWGNDTTTHNTVYGVFYCLNSPAGLIRDNYIGNGMIFYASTTNAPVVYSISSNNLTVIDSLASVFIEMSPDTSSFIGNVIKTTTNISFSGTTIDPTSGNLYQQYVSTGYRNSTYVETLDITGATTLDITALYSSYIGCANLYSSNASEAIDLFANFATGSVIRFYPQTGITITFIHATGANQPRCENGVNAVVNGTNGDWIEFTKSYDGSNLIFQSGGKTY